MVELEQEVVVIDAAGHAKVLGWQSENICLHLVNGVDIGQDRRIVERRLSVALSFVVDKEERAIPYNRPSQRSPELVLA